jgi:hypothetical protein
MHFARHTKVVPRLDLIIISLNKISATLMAINGVRTCTKGKIIIAADI